MKKNVIKKALRESASEIKEVAPHVKDVVSTKDSEESGKDRKEEKVSQLLSNDIINHAGVIRKMSGEEWTNNDEATNRSKFRKKLKKMQNDAGSTYSFDDDELSQIEKILMGLSSTISNSIGRQGK